MVRAVWYEEGREGGFQGLRWREGCSKVVTSGAGAGLRGSQTRNMCVKVCLLCRTS